MLEPKKISPSQSSTDPVLRTISEAGSQSLLQILLENVFGAITITGAGPEFPIVAQSRFAEELLGRACSSFLGASCDDAAGLYFPDGETRPRPEEMPLYRAYFLGETIQNEQWSIVRSDGTSRTVLLDVSPIREASGKITGSVNCWRDITEWKEIEKHHEAALRNSDARFRNMADSSPVLIWQTDQTGVTFVNRQYLAFFGVPFERVAGNGWMDFLHSDDRDSYAVKYYEACKRGERYELQSRFRRSDGEYRWLHNIAMPHLDSENAFAGFVGCSFDVTDIKTVEDSLRESEERFRHIADHAPVMIWMTAPDGSSTYLSKSWYEFTGLTPELSLGAGWFVATHPDDRERIATEYRQAIERREPVRIDYRLRRADGEYRWIIDSAIPRFNTVGEFEGFIGSVIDITERKQLEETLRNSDRRKDEFLAMLAHELRNPLAPIRSAAQVLKRSGTTPSEKNLASEVIERQTEHLTRLVDDLLDVSRITQGKIALKYKNLQLSNVVHRALEICRPIFESRQHQFSLTLPGEVLFVKGDLTRLIQVIGNVLNNAAKYTEDGGKIALQVTRDGKEGVITIRDNGVGLAPEVLPYVFELFTQADRSLDRADGGLGIGLTLVRNLVELHGGTVRAHSDGLGKGSEFFIRLPLVDGEEAESSLAENVEVSGAPLRILIVEDHPDSAELLKILLQAEGHDVRIATDGLAALELAQEYSPQVVLCDIGLPKLNGYEVAQKFRTLPFAKETKLIALSGYGQEEDRERSKNAGFDFHLTKPVETHALIMLLSSIN